MGDKILRLDRTYPRARVLTRSVLSTVAGLTVFAGAFATNAVADPADEALAKLTELSRQAEQTTEAMHSAQLDLNKKLAAQQAAEKKHTDDQAGMDAAKARLAMFQGAVNKLAAATYMGGRVDGMAAILTAGSPQSLIDKLAMQRLMAAQMRTQMASFRVAGEQAAKAEQASAKSAADAKSAAEQAAAVRASLQSKQSQLQVQIAVVKSQYVSLSPQQRTALADPGPIPAGLPAPGAPGPDALPPGVPPPGGQAPGEAPPPAGMLPGPFMPGPFTGGGDRANVVQAALTQVGSSYVWGGAAPHIRGPHLGQRRLYDVRPVTSARKRSGHKRSGQHAGRRRSLTRCLPARGRHAGRQRVRTRRARRREAGRDRPGVGERGALLGRQRHVLRLDDRDLDLQLALLGLQARPDRGRLFGRALRVGRGLRGRLFRLGGLLAGNPEARHLRPHLSRHQPLHRQFVDQTLRRPRGQDGRHPVDAATHVGRGGQFVDRALEHGEARLRRIHAGLVVRVLLLCGLLSCEFLVQVKLRAVHRLGRLLGLAGEFGELCQRLVGRVGDRVRGKSPREDGQARYRTQDRACKNTRTRVRTVEPQNFIPQRPSTDRRRTGLGLKQVTKRYRCLSKAIR